MSWRIFEGVASVVLAAALIWIGTTVSNTQLAVAKISTSLEKDVTEIKEDYDEHEGQLKTIWPRLRGVEQDVKVHEHRIENLEKKRGKRD